MECDKLERFLHEEKCGSLEQSQQLLKHAEECRECAGYLLFDNILHSQKEAFEKAPGLFLYNTQRKIRAMQDKKHGWRLFEIFRPMAKPAIAFSTLLLIAAALYLNVKTSPIGVVDNLVDRFNVSDLKNIKTGDVLYVSKQIFVDLTLSGNVKVQLDSNTVLQLRAKDKIALFRGQITLATANKTMVIETPNGSLILKNAKAIIQTAQRDEQGAHRAQTSCWVIGGSAAVKNAKGTALVSPGQEIILADNGTVQRKNSLPDSSLRQQDFTIPGVSKTKVFTAKEQICNCLYDMRYDSDNKQLHGKEMKESKFPVRVFWQNKIHIESLRRLDETYCFFDAGGGLAVHFGNSPGI